MANLDTPMGFRPYKNCKTKYVDLSATNSRIAPGDIVIRDNAGYVNIYSSATDQVIGVAQELKAANSGGQILIVYNLDEAEFYAQIDDASSGTADAKTAANLNIDIVATGSGTNIHSLMELDENTANTTNTLMLKILDKFPAHDNAYGAYMKWIVKFNRYCFAPNIAGI